MCRRQYRVENNRQYHNSSLTSLFLYNLPGRSFTWRHANFPDTLLFLGNWSGSSQAPVVCHSEHMGPLRASGGCTWSLLLYVRYSLLCVCSRMVVARSPRPGALYVCDRLAFDAWGTYLHCESDHALQATAPLMIRRVTIASRWLRGTSTHLASPSSREFQELA